RRARAAGASADPSSVGARAVAPRTFNYRPARYRWSGAIRFAHRPVRSGAVSVWGALLIAAAMVAFVDWWAVATGRRRVEHVAKPLTMALLVGVAATAGDPGGDVRTWLVVGAALGLIGDIALMGDGEVEFMIGLGAFALGHLAYAVAAVLVGFDPAW